MKKDKKDSKGTNQGDNQNNSYNDGINKAFPYNLPEHQSQEWHKSDQNTLITQRRFFTYVFFLN